MNNYKRAIISAWTAGLLLLSGGLAKSANLQVAKEIPVLPAELVAYTSEYQPQSRTATQSDTFLASNSQRQQINFPHFSFQSLEKSGWQIIQQGRDRVEFGKQTSTIMCRVTSFEQRVLDSNLRHSSASEVANFFRERERQGMIQMGVNRGIYELENLVMDEEDVNDKHFFTMKYETILDSSVTMNNSLYLFFPQTEDNEFFFAVLYIESSENQGSSTTTCQEDLQELLSSIELSNLESSLEATEINEQATRLYNQGNRLRDQGLLPQAESAFRQAIELKPDYTWAYNNLGVVVAMQGRLDEAITIFRQAIEIDPNHVSAYDNLGHAFQLQGNFEESIQAYQQAIEIDPNDDNYYFGLGLSLKKQGNLTEAIVAYRKAIQLNPKNTRALNNLGIVYEELGQYEIAIEYYQQAVNIHEEIRQNLSPEQQESYLTTIKSYRNLVDLLILTGRNEEAERILDRLN